MSFSLRQIRRGVGLEIPPHGILESGSALQVAIESVRDVENALDVFHAQRFIVVHSQGLGCADCVLDLFDKVSNKFSENVILEGRRRTYLSTVQIVSCQRIVIILIKRHRSHTLQYPNALDEHLEHALLRLGAQFAISQSNMNS